MKKQDVGGNQAFNYLRQTQAYIIILIVSSIMIGCVEELPLFESSISLHQSVLEIKSGPSTQTIQVLTNSSWKATTNVEWIIFDKGIKEEGMVTSEKSQLYDFTFDVLGNSNLEDRAGVITFHTVDGNSSVEMKVTQPSMLTENIYVTINGSGIGYSWEDATRLDVALDMAKAGNTIHIAAGIYNPTTLIASADAGLSARDRTFEVSKNISIIGGYPTKASTGVVSDPKVNATILSGDLGAFGKVYHTMVITARQVSGQQVSISGITIKDGNAIGTESVISAANGALLDRGKAGGIYLANSKVEFLDCNIVDNNATSGPAMTTWSSANITLTRCLVDNNNATANGGGIFVEGPKTGADAIFALYDCTISNNNGGSTGSGLYTLNSCKIMVHNSTITKNKTVRSGAGIYVREGTKGYIVNSTIHGNIAEGRAGLTIYGIEKNRTSFDVINTTITANNGTTIGGLDIVQYATSNIYNSIISGNSDPSKELNLNSTGITYKLKNVIVSDSIYDNKGLIVNNVTFDKSTIGDLAFFKPDHYTETCQIGGSNNPAHAGYGMTVSELANLANTYSPVIPNQVIIADQNGKSREGLTTIGAVVK